MLKNPLKKLVSRKQWAWILTLKANELFWLLIVQYANSHPDEVREFFKDAGKREGKSPKKARP